MSDQPRLKVAIVDFGLGNLFSVHRACERVGLDAEITNSKQQVLAADAVLLPGVGAFGDAMDNLTKADLVGPLRYIHHSGKPLIGICLGQQLLMSESEEFGCHKGLGLIDGTVTRFCDPHGSSGQILKIPQVGWNRIHRPSHAGTQDIWADSPLAGQAEGAYMYFVHSYYVQPTDPSVRLSVTRYGDVEFCSSVRVGNTCAFQFHPEKSGTDGLQIYQQIAQFISQRHSLTEYRHAG